MSKNPHWRESRVPIAFPTEFLVALSKIQAKYENGFFYSVLLIVNEGLDREGVIPKEEYLLFRQRYERKAVERANEGRENSHIPKIELEKKKATKEGMPEKKSVDYSGFALESLEKSYASADYATRNAILFAMKKKGIDIRAFQRQQEGEAK